MASSKLKDTLRLLAALCDREARPVLDDIKTIDQGVINRARACSGHLGNFLMVESDGLLLAVRIREALREVTASPPVTPDNPQEMFTQRGWKAAVAAGATLLGYQEWVESQVKRGMCRVVVTGSPASAVRELAAMIGRDLTSQGMVLPPYPSDWPESVGELGGRGVIVETG